MTRRIILFFIIILSTYTYCGSIEIDMRARELELIAIETKRIEFIREEQLNLFLNAMGFHESRNNPEVYNEFGYIGMFQFGQSARNATGYGHIKYSDFVKNPSIWPKQEQISAMKTLLQKNELRLLQYIIKTPYKIGNITITKSGLLASAHLAGSDNVRRFLESNGVYNPKDAYGTSITKYMIMFSSYEF